MRVLVLAGAAAAVVLAAVAVAAVGLVGDDEQPWSERASTVCERGLAEARAVAGAGDSVAGAERRAVQVYAAATEVEAGVLAELDALPRPSADELAIERTLAILRRSHEADVAAIERLRRDFDAQLFERRVNETIPVLADARSRFAALGAAGCVRYYDPESYR